MSAGLVHATKKRLKTEPDRRLWLHAFQTMQPDRFGLIATGFEGDRLQQVAQVIPLKKLHILSPF